MGMAATLTRGMRNQSPPVPYVPKASRTSQISIPWAQKNTAEQQMAAMGSVGTLFAIVHKLSTSVAGNDWGLYRESTSTDPADPIEITRHAALDLLSKPNPFMPWQEFAEVTQQHIDLTGEGWWVIARNPRVQSIPLEMWPVRPDRMAPVPNANEFIRGYIYTGPDGEEVPLKLNEVIQLRMPNPLDIYRGLGPVQALLVDLDSAQYTAEWNRNFFKNSAEPGGVIQVEKRLSDDEFDEMTMRWSEQHKGVANAHRVAIIEQGQWVDRKFSMRDMQFTELRRVSRDVILEGFGFPKAMLGATDGINFANAKAAEYMYGKWLIKTRLDRIKGAIDNELLPMFGPAAAGMTWMYESPVPQDQDAENAELKTKVEAFATLVGAGVSPVDASDAVELPRFTMAPKPAPPPIPDQTAPALPVARLNGHHRELMPV